MNNNKHPDHHFDDDLIAQLYDASKEKMQPTTDLDDLILSKLNGSAGDERVDVDGSTENKIVSLSLAKEDSTRRSKNTSTKNPWFVPNSLVACLVVSAMVGLLYRENADQLLISDPMELDYAMPMPSVFDEGESSKGENREIQGDRVLMDSVSSSLELRLEKQSRAKSKVQRGFETNDVEAPLIMEQVVPETELATVQSGAASVSSAVVEPEPVVELKVSASHKAKKRKPKPAIKREERAKMLMMAPPMHLQKRVQKEVQEEVQEELQNNAVSFDVHFNQIRTLRDAGDVKAAIVILDALLAEHPSLDLPDDILLLKQER